YTMHVVLDPEHHDLRGDATIVWRNASRTPQKEIYLHLYLNAFKNERSVFFRTPASGFRGGGSIADFGHIEVDKLTMRGVEGELWSSAERAAGAPPADASLGLFEDETDMRVPLPSEVAPGATATFDVAWHAHLPSLIMRTGYAGSFHMVAQW